MQNVFAAFPGRPLRLARSGAPSLFMYAILALITFVLLALPIKQAPGLARDYAISSNPMVVNDWKLHEGECLKGRKAPLVTCEADLSYTVAGTRYDRSLAFTFVSFSNERYDVALLVSADNPGLATFDLALDTFWNRAASFLFLVAAFGSAMFFALREGARAWRIRRAAQRQGPMTPVAVNVDSVDVGTRRLVASYNWRGPNGAKRALTSWFKKGSAPFYLSPEPDDHSALAVIPHGSDVPILLDEALEMLDLTPSEREAIWAARDQQAAA